MLSTCQGSRWLCEDHGTRCEELAPGCAEGEAPCQESGHCVPHEWLCDNQDDCGDGSDEEGECPHLRVAVAKGQVSLGCVTDACDLWQLQGCRSHCQQL